MPWVPPDPPLRTDAVLLRPFHTDDAAFVAAACQDPAIPRFTFMKEGLTTAEAIEWIEKSAEWWPAGHPRFAIVDPDDDRLLGQVGASVNDHYRSAEAYYWLAADQRGRGVAQAALGLLADWLFDSQIERLHLLIHPENVASNRVAERSGFTREGVLRAFEPFKGGRPDVVSWSLLPDDPRPWRASR